MSASSTWYPGIQQACAHWLEAQNLQQTFEAFEQAFAADNDTILNEKWISFLPPPQGGTGRF